MKNKLKLTDANELFLKMLQAGKHLKYILLLQLEYITKVAF
jgi:hypothetical protein